MKTKIKIPLNKGTTLINLNITEYQDKKLILLPYPRIKPGTNPKIPSIPYFPDKPEFSNLYYRYQGDEKFLNQINTQGIIIQIYNKLISPFPANKTIWIIYRHEYLSTKFQRLYLLPYGQFNKKNNWKQLSPENQLYKESTLFLKLLYNNP